MKRRARTTGDVVAALRRRGLRVDESQVKRVSSAAKSLPPKLSARDRGYHDLQDAFALQLAIALVGRAPLPVPEYEFALPRKWRWDFAWPGLKLAVEIQGGTKIRGGGRHNRHGGLEGDAEKLSMGAVLGWRVIIGTGDMVRDGRLLVLVEQALGLRPL